MAGLLPASVRLRNDKADFSGLFVDAVETLAASQFRPTFELTRRAWLTDRASLALYRRMRSHIGRGWAAYSDDAWSLWAIAGLEIWVRSMLEGRDGETGRAA